MTQRQNESIAPIHAIDKYAGNAAEVREGLREAREALAALWHAHVEAGNHDLKDRASRALSAVIIAGKQWEKALRK